MNCVSDLAYLFTLQSDESINLETLMHLAGNPCYLPSNSSRLLGILTPPYHQHKKTLKYNLVRYSSPTTAHNNYTQISEKRQK